MLAKDPGWKLLEMAVLADQPRGGLRSDARDAGIAVGRITHQRQVIGDLVRIDAIYNPVRRANFTVAETRVGQRTDYDRLTVMVETNGTITPEEALSRSAEILVNQFRPFVTIGMAAIPQAVATGVAALPPNMLDMPIEELDLPMRAYNSLKRNNIVKVGQLLQLKDDELLRMRNFGKKSLDEMKERLRMRGFILPETEPSEFDGDESEDETPFEDEDEA